FWICAGRCRSKIARKTQSDSFRRFFSADRGRGNLSAKRFAENYLGRRWSWTSALVPVAQARKRRSCRRRSGTGFATLASAHHARTLPKCSAASRAPFFEIECRSRWGIGARRVVSSLFEQTGSGGHGSHARAHTFLERRSDTAVRA